MYFGEVHLLLVFQKTTCPSVFVYKPGHRVFVHLIKRHKRGGKTMQGRKRRNKMRILKIVTVSLLVLCFIRYISVFDFKTDLSTLYIALGIITIHNIITFKNSILKIKAIFRGEARITRGLVYCLCSLPISYRLIRRIDHPYAKEQLIVYFFILIIAIFNFGIGLKTDKT